MNLAQRVKQMFSIESQTHQPKARAVRLVHLTPFDLRQAANRLEDLAKGAVPGESVLCELTRSITAVYRPDVNMDARPTPQQIEFTPDEVL